MEDNYRNMICVNYDQIRRSDINFSMLKAFIACGHHIDFCRNNKLLASCTEIIGSPMMRIKGMRNNKPTFSGLQKKRSVVKVINGIELIDNLEYKN